MDEKSVELALNAAAAEPMLSDKSGGEEKPAGHCTSFSQPKPGTFIFLLRQFCEMSSMRSVPRIVRAPTHVQRTLWVFALLAGVAMTSFQLYHLLGLYLSYRTSINMVHVKNVAPFPDVTVCNLNPLWEAKSSRLNVTLTYDKYLDKLHTHFKDFPADKKFLLDYLQTYEGYLQYFSEGDLNQVRDHLVWDCRWEYREGMQPQHCQQNISRHLSPYYGPCSTFHISNILDLKNQPSRLSMLLFVNDFAQGEIMDFILSSYYTYSSGVRVLVHAPGTFPLMDEGVNLPPGHESTISVHSYKRQLMGAPYDGCLHVGHIKTEYSESDAYTYTKRVCKKFCQQDYVISKCGCVDPYTPFPKSYRNINTSFCGLLDFDDARSVTATLQQLECLHAHIAIDGGCDCPQPCSQFLYDIEVSQVPWPQISYHMALYKKYIAGSPFAPFFSEYKDIDAKMKVNRSEAFKLLRQTDLIRRNFLEISVMLNAEQTTLMEDYPVLSLESLFGNMGGILNLWVGITFVTAVEIMDLVWICFSGNKNGRNLIKSRLSAPDSTQ